MSACFESAMNRLCIRIPTLTIDGRISCQFVGSFSDLFVDVGGRLEADCAKRRCRSVGAAIALILRFSLDEKGVLRADARQGDRRGYKGEEESVGFHGVSVRGCRCDDSRRCG